MHKRQILGNVLFKALTEGMLTWGQPVNYDPRQVTATVVENNVEVHNVNAATIELGVQRIVYNQVQYLRPDVVSLVTSAVTAKTDKDIDGYTAGLILQAGLFGKIKYV